MENQSNKTAIVAGATGLVGEQLLIQLLADPQYTKVIAVVRKPLRNTHEKLEQILANFEQLPAALMGITADHGYCCLGTTIKTAGSKEKQVIVDHDYVVMFAKACHSVGVTRFAVVSSIGANLNSSNFYLRTKGEMERDLRQIPFTGTCIVQPSLLIGDRKEFRTGEKTASAIMRILDPLLIGSLKKYRGVNASNVARVMIEQMSSNVNGVKFIRSDEIK